MHAILGFAVALLLQAQETKAEPFLKDIEAFETRDKKTPPPENEIVAVGSSSIRFWQSTEAFPDLKIINRGFGGSLMSDSLHYCDRIVTNYKPRIVVVFAGGNDINAKHTPERVADDYKALCGKIHEKLPKTKIYFISLFPNVQRKSQDPACQKVNQLIEAYSKTDPRLGYIDTRSKLSAEDGGPRPDLLRPDGLHMNDDGYKIWNEVVGAVLRKAP